MAPTALAKRPRTIATINFKGGVGKTTVTWCLADVLSLASNSKVLMFDLDAQMSLTQAIALNESGHLNDSFWRWYERAYQLRSTIFHALLDFNQTALPPYFPFESFIYKISNNLHFVPSVEDLYWLELDQLNRESVRNFIRKLLSAIYSYQQLPKYDFIIFDCPPSFTYLSYSVLSCCDLVLIPVNPDFFAAKGVNLLLKSLKVRIAPQPLPKIAVFMNKAKKYRGKPTKEVTSYIRDIERVCTDAVLRDGIRANFLSSMVSESVGIKRAIVGGEVPPALVSDFKNLWIECVEYLG